MKKFHENIELYRPEGEFTTHEKIEHIASLTGIFPFDLVLNEQVQSAISRHHCPPISKYDPDLGIVWFIPREIIKRKTKNGKDYWILNVIDSTGSETRIRCWGVRKYDRIVLNHPYAGKLDYNDQWGFSTRSIGKNLKLLG